MRIPRPPSQPSTWAAIGIYGLLLMAAMLEQVGKTTHDTKTPLTESPSTFLEGSLGLWNPLLSLGELQNQAYGYLFPQGPFYLLADLAAVAPWISERIWSWLILVAGCEGARRLAKAMAMSPWAAWAAGMAYGLNPRVISQVGTRSGEILPMAVLPWVALPIVLALTGRLGIRRAALFSAAAYMFTGALNATATVAILPLVFITIVWGVRRGLVRIGLLGWWCGLVVVVSVWWAASLMKLRVYSPPFFDYVEDADVTTKTTGYTSALRGASNWIMYNATGGYPTWPAGFQLAYEPWMVLASGLLAAIGIMGLVTWRSPWRTPLVLSVLLGMVCLVVGHDATLGSPINGAVRDLLDGDYDLFRNVSKIDPIVRLPLTLGVGAAFARAAAWASAAVGSSALRSQVRVVFGRVGVAVLAFLVLLMAQPAVALNLRTPGWTDVPDYWHQTADYLEKQGPDTKAWVIPGSGFGVQTWGWTMDEPMSAVAKTPWVTRSQVPLVPPETIRVLSRLEQFLASGAGSPNLGAMLARLGISQVVVRHDLDPSLSEATAINLVSIAMARSEGVTRQRTIGEVDFGPAIEIFSVDDEPAASISVVSDRDAVTVAGASADVVDAVGQGLVEPDQAAIVQGDDGWQRPADVVGDSYRLRERNFGRVNDAEGAVLAPGEPRHSTRVVGDYPGNPGSKPVTAKYSRVEYVDASSSMAYTSGFGEVRPENAPFAAVDDDLESAWRSAYLADPVGQWIDVHLAEPQEIGRLTVLSTVANPVLGEVTRWRVDAGGERRRVEVDPFTGEAEVDLTGVVSDRIRLTVEAVNQDRGGAPIGVQDIDFEGPAAERTLVVPAADTAPDAAYVFTARPEVRTCITTLLAPDCSFGRGRLSDESAGIDRTFEVSNDQTVRLTGTAIARSRLAAHRLLDPIGGPVVVRASSTLASDPTVSARMSYDGDGATSWIADPYDPEPTLTVDFAAPRTLKRIGVAQPAQPAVTPTQAIIKGGGETRVVDLGDFGTFEPIRAQRFTISFSNPTRGLSPLGMSELYLGPKGVTLPFDGAAETGALCGFGPVVELDGKRYETSVEGFMGSVVSAGPLDLRLCDDKGVANGELELTAGTHRLRVISTDEFQPVIATLETTEADPVREPSREVEVLSDEPSVQRLELGPGDAAILRTTRNYNTGWVAELNGQELPVQRVDGWAQGWRVPEGEGGSLVIRYAPERSYVVLLFTGLGVALAILLLALVLVVRTKLTPGVQPAEPEPRRRRRVVVAGVLVGAALPAWVGGGLPAAAGLLLAAGFAVFGWRRPAVWLAGLLLVAGPTVAAVAQHLDGGVDQPVADLLTGTGLLLAVGSILVRSRPPRETASR